MKTYLLTNLAIAVSAATPYQDLDTLDARVALVLGASGTAMPIDRRIKLATCPDEPEISSPSSGVVSVRCVALGWRIRVPVSGPTANSEASAQLLVHRGDTIELVARGAGYSVSSVGTALEEEPAGASIRVAAMIARAGVATIPH